MAILGTFLIGSNAFGTTNYPADKMTVAGDNVDVPATNTPEIVLEAHLKTSSTEDLVLQLTMECEIATMVTTTGTADSTAFGQIQAWITIDGTVVPVGPSNGDDGKIVFCNRAHTQSFMDSDGNGDTLTQYLKTRDANAFNWVKLNAGGAGTIHDIKVWVEYSNTNTTTNASSDGVVGRRTLTVMPTKAGVNETLG